MYKHKIHIIKNKKNLNLNRIKSKCNINLNKNKKFKNEILAQFLKKLKILWLNFDISIFFAKFIQTLGLLGRSIVRLCQLRLQRIEARTSSTCRVSKHLHRDIRGSPPWSLPSDSRVHANRQLTAAKSDYKRIRGIDTREPTLFVLDFQANQLRTYCQISLTMIDLNLYKLVYFIYQQMHVKIKIIPIPISALRYSPCISNF